MSKKLNTVEYLNKAEVIHGDRYLYDKTEYVDALTKLTITCREHGDFKTLPNKHLSRNCKLCANKTRFRKFYKRTLEKKFEGLIQPEDHKLIPLGNNIFAKVDNEDFNKLRTTCWFKDGGGNDEYYAYSKEMGLMHRYLMGDPEGKLVDHEDGDKLNNRRSNLRVATPQQNKFNSKVRSDSTLGVKGVTKYSNRFFAKVQSGKIKRRSKLFDTISEAVDWYNNTAKELHGEFFRESEIKIIK